MIFRFDLFVDFRFLGDVFFFVCFLGVFYVLLSRFLFFCFDFEFVMIKYNFDNSMLVLDILKLLYIVRINFCLYVIFFFKNI